MRFNGYSMVRLNLIAAANGFGGFMTDPEIISTYTKGRDRLKGTFTS